MENLLHYFLLLISTLLMHQTFIFPLEWDSLIVRRTLLDGLFCNIDNERRIYLIFFDLDVKRCV